MPTLEGLLTDISSIIQDASYTDPVLISRINAAVEHIAGGIRMPDKTSYHGQYSPPLPDLMAFGTVTASADAAYVSLPDDYQRNVFYVADARGDRIGPVQGGSYYDFTLFLNRVMQKDLSETGSIYAVCVRGNKLYYQGKNAEDLTVHYYRKPTAMVAAEEGEDSPEPDGLPSHLAGKLIKHYVCREIFGEAIEDGESSVGKGYSYHTARFFEAMTELIDFIGIDAEPVYFAAGSGGYRANDWDYL